MEAFGASVADKALNWTLDKVQNYWNLDNNLKSLEKELQRLSDRKSDIELEVINTERSDAKKRKREVNSWFEEVEEMKNDFNALKNSVQEGGFRENAIRSGERVEKIGTRVKDLLEQSLHFDKLCVNAFGNRNKPRVTEKLFGEKFDEGLKRILAWLEIDNISNIGIYGMGGVGKTTLARHIHDHLLKNRNFKIYWVTVSQEFNIKKLQDDIAKCLGLDPWNEDDEHTRAAILSEALVQGSVLILDDVWKEIRLKEIGIFHGASKCRLIFTTRSRQVCTGMDCQRELEVKTLDKNESWDLFKTTLRLKMELPADVEKVVQSVTERCAGLPLGIVAVAGSMKGVTDIREWRNALEQLKACSVGHDEMERDVFPILEWSFNRLNKCERNCFLYCCLYPEDSKLKRKGLIDLFIWAELMQKRNSWSQEFDQGHAILNKLIKVCLLEETRDSKGDDCVKMHDLVRDMALRITHGNSKPNSSRDDVPRFLVKSLGHEDSIVALEQEEWTQDLCAISFYSQNSEGIEIPPGWSPNCPKLSTLLLSYCFIEEIPDSFFRHMCGLKVLNLEGCKGITELPNSVSDMVNLTAFILRDCTRLRSVPPLGKLKQLRDLDLSWTDIEDLPQGWESLVNLESLNLGDCRSLKRKIIPKETFSQFHRLQLLLLPPYVRVQVNDPEVLNQLESFTRCLSFTDFYKITWWPKYYNNVYINDILTKYPSYDNDEYGYQGKQLYFHQCKLGRGLNNLPDDMESLIIEDCKGIGIRCLSDVFRNFTNLSDLSELFIEDSIGIEFLWQLSSTSPRHQLEVSSFSPLRDLQVLSLRRLPNLVGLFYGESEPYLFPAATFSSLKDLWIHECHNMKQLFTLQLLQNLQNLETLGVEDCEGLEEIAADGNGEGQGGREGIQLTSSGGAITMISLPNLRCLSLDMLPQLNNICKAAMICDSIEKIEIFSCPKVKRLPLFLPTINGLPSLPSKLRMITGDKQRWESEPLLPAGTHSSLKRMCISRCHNMKQLFTMQLQPNLQNLQELDIEDCEGLEEIAADGNAVGQGEGEGTQLNSSGGATTMISLPNLSCLSLHRLPQLNNICKAAMICNSIEEIKIFDCPKVKRLPLFLPTINGLPSLPSTLRKIKGDKEWWESLEWDYPSAKNALDPFFTAQP